jgi:hypothetical protein
MQNLIKKVVWVCLGVIPFIALYVASGRGLDIFSLGEAGMYFPYISGKNFAFRVLVEIAFAGWVLLALRDASYRINLKKSPLLLAYAAFVIILFLASGISVVLMFPNGEIAYVWSRQGTRPEKSGCPSTV